MGAGSTYAVNDTGGSANAVVVSHTHTATVTDPGHFHTGGATQYYIGEAGGHGYVTNVANTSTAVTGITVANSTEGVSATNANLVPYYALAFIMKS